MSEQKLSSPKINRAFFIIVSLLLVIYAVMLVRTAWAYDDVYITLRTIDNFVNGYGLTWNVSERVQAYTHPLWMFLIASIYVLTHESFLTVIFLSMVVSLAAMVVYVLGFADKNRAVIAGLLILIMSKFYVDFSTSGFENPLTHLLAILFAVVFLKRQASLSTLFYLSLLASLSLLNRMDTALLFAPALLYSFWQIRSVRAIGVLVSGMMPFILWEVFSLWYYGSLVPNTALAKLNNGISHWDLLAQGAHYLEGAFRGDRVLVLTIFTVIGLTLWRRGPTGWPLAAGVLGYILYVVYIGGCFIGGRFFTAPLLLSVILLTQYEKLFSGRKIYYVAGLTIVLGLTINGPPLLSGRDFGSDPGAWGFGYEIEDSRLLVFQSNGLCNNLGWQKEPSHYWVENGRRYRELKIPIAKEGGIGFVGYYGGRGTHIIDFLALADPLLARLPALKKNSWRPGHFRRAIPEGYPETVEQNKNLIKDPWLAAYYDTLSLIIKEPLFSPGRLSAICKLNLGGFDYLLEKAEPQIQSILFNDINRPLPRGIEWWHPDVTVVPEDGILIKLQHPVNFEKIEISFDSNDDYLISYKLGDKIIGESRLWNENTESTGLIYKTIDVPNDIYSVGYDAIKFLPNGSKGDCALGHISFETSGE
ncbi:MAG: hypothetical protein V3V99_13135 [candidate division Zixibacteria bacterium]